MKWWKYMKVEVVLLIFFSTSIHKYGNNLYYYKGMSHDDAKACIGIMSKYNQFFVDVMMVEELGLKVPVEGENYWFEGLLTFSSFTLSGCIPLIALIGNVGIFYNFIFFIQ